MEDVATLEFFARDVIDLDYIVISHAHFDHLPGADRLALKTSATVIADCEAINFAGGERVPLFTKDILTKASENSIEFAPSPPLALPKPHVKFASLAVHVWPSLHSLMLRVSPHDIPEVFDTNKSDQGGGDGYACSLDITQLIWYGLFRLEAFIPEDHMDAGTSAFSDYIQDRKKNIMSPCDGGKFMCNFIIGVKIPKPDVAILGAGGRANLNGRPFVGSAAEFLKLQTQWLHEPPQILFCLHDESIIKPYKTDVIAAKEVIEQHTRSKVLGTELATPYVLFQK
ncbi:hypothetical protein COCMIDRAFT_35068 [Bipolaris oryzae ATCC 44560]|uniref:Metallo-beta-lactamase domain-containing protein n=1 Tax=Bipolaris oryzae ATCC 44560 TaxID=930090 RepID=W6ZC50_COCMI|nr:uncharacterized protein COCMIDRAFT_35068 [Bipolaris oryzae ATCC 44560]EUC47378.1 hypothetical protein COCMIDRAFT_35068 [Bipolaris oryzae ATCC 44560]